MSKEKSPWSDLGAALATLSLEDFLSFRLTRLAGGVRRGLTRHYAEHYNLSVPEWRILAAVVRFNPINFGDLFRLSQYDKALVSRTVALLKEKGLLTTLADPSHKKRVTVKLTRAGSSAYKKILPEARRRQVELLGALSETERNVLYEALSKLQQKISTDFEGNGAAN